MTPRAALLADLVARVAEAAGAAAPTAGHALACWADLAVREARAVALTAAAQARAGEMRAEAAAVEARAASLAGALASVRLAQHGHTGGGKDVGGGGGHSSGGGGGGGGGDPRSGGAGASGVQRSLLEARSVREMEAKRAEYDRAVVRCARKVAAAGVAGDPPSSPPLGHDALRARGERLLRRRDHALRAAERRAAEFGDLPASVAGARAALERARSRLARSQERLELGLAQL